MPAARAGSDPIVTLLPTVTDEMLMGTVPLMDAVTLPICAVPATNAGSVVSETGCVAGKLDMLAVTLPICAVPAGRAEPMLTVPEMGRGFTTSIVPRVFEI